VSTVEATYSASAGLDFDDRLLESRLLWIWGSPRSGSSWLLDLLCDPLEPYIRTASGFRHAADAEPRDALDIVPIDESFLANHLAPALGDPIEIGGDYVADTQNRRRSNDPGYVFSDAFRQAWEPEYRRFVLVRLWEIAARARRDGIALVDHPVYAIKEVNGSHAADQLMSLLPSSRMLFLARDGRDVVDSLLAAYSPGGFLARDQGRVVDSPEERREAVTWAARLWACNCDTVLAAQRSHSSELVRVVRYEELLADCAKVMTGLFQWLGLERRDDWIERMVARRSFAAVPDHKRGEGKRTRSARPGRWRENLTEDEQRVVMEIVGPRLDALGYQR
jgi:Sulfotransferase family